MAADRALGSTTSDSTAKARHSRKTPNTAPIAAFRVLENARRAALWALFVARWTAHRRARSLRAARRAEQKVVVVSELRGKTPTRCAGGGLDRLGDMVWSRSSFPATAPSCWRLRQCSAAARGQLSAQRFPGEKFLRRRGRRRNSELRAEPEYEIVDDRDRLVSIRPTNAVAVNAAADDTAAAPATGREDLP